MKTALLVLALAASNAALADIVYLNDGRVLSGSITRQDQGGIVRKDHFVELTYSDGRIEQFPVNAVFQALDDAGSIIFPAPKPTPGEVQNNLGTPAPSLPMPVASAPLMHGEYRTKYRFPFWPLLGGAALLGYIGVSQLEASSGSFDEADQLERAGLDFGASHDRAQRQRTWGQISLAGAAACLIVALTPRVEKIPVNHSLRLAPTPNGLALSFNL